MIDYCTCFPEGSWDNCCAMHDRRYANKRLTRYQADKLLYRCVAKHNKVVALIMFIGVRLGGWYFYDKATNPIGV